MPIDRDLHLESLASVLRQVPAYMAVLRGAEHRFEVVNPSFRELVPDQDPLGRTVRDVFAGVAGDELVDLLDRVYRTGEPNVVAEQAVRLLPTAGGAPEERFLNFVYQPHTTSAGEIVGIIVHGVDVTDLVMARRTAEEQAEELQLQATRLEEAQEELAAANRLLGTASGDAEKARARLEAVIQQMPSGVVINDAVDGTLLLANRQVEEIWRSPTPAPGEGWAPIQCFHPDGRPYTQQDWPIERARRGEAILGEEMSIVRSDGSRAVISVNSAPIRDRSGTVVAAVAVFDDVTDRWQHEHDQAFLVDAARILASSLDYQETLRSVARLSVPRIADWCAIDIIEEGVSQRLAVVHSDPEKEKLAEEVARRWPADPGSGSVARVLENGEPELFAEVTDELLRATAQDDEHLKLLRELGIRSAMVLPMVARGRTLGAITFIAAESGRTFGASDLRVAEKLASRGAMAIDNALLLRQAERSRDDAEIAQRRAEDARRAAEAASQAKSEFLANMSHEMRTPLNAVTGYTELLEMEIGGPLTEQQRAQLARIRNSTDHLLTLINDLLDLARIESGRLEVHPERESAKETMEAAAALLGPQAAERDIHLSWEEEGAGAEYVGDRDRVRQILVNLIGNAVKFTPRDGTVRIVCGSAEGELPPELAGDTEVWTFFRVEDTGVGIPPEQMERIFRPFEQVQGGYTRETGGAGLGLSISRRLALLMGGDITGTSRPGEGSTFTLWLPQQDPEPLTEIDGFSSTAGNGLAAVGTVLLGGVDRILEQYIERLRSDPVIPSAAGLSEGELKDHHSSLISDFAASLIVLDAPGESRVRLLQDGGEIQRLLADLHGKQRAQLGWSELALEREFDIWGEELRRELRDSQRLREERTVLREGLEVIEQLVERARRVSLRAFRAASAGMVRGTQ